MKQKQIITIAGLINQGGVLVGAAAEIGTAIGLHHNKEEKIEADLTALVNATNFFASARDEWSRRKGVLKTLEREVCLHLRKARDSFIPMFGYVYSDAWTVLGYRNSLEAPDKVAVQTAMMEALRAFYTNHPELQLPTASLSAEGTGDLLEVLMEAQSAVASQQSVMRVARNERDLRAKQMRTRVVALVQELKQLIGPMDPRWLNFGLNRPGALEVPEPPTNLQVEMAGNSSAALRWNRGARSSHYRVYVKVHGVDAQYLHVASPADQDCMLENLRAGASHEVVIRAVNATGESRASEVLTFTIPPLQA
jgi:hypothetical protein